MRKISAHYAFLSHGEFVKYPIITFNNESISDISFSDALTEMAGLEFYSGVLFPYFDDQLMPSEYDELLNHSSFKSTIISQIIVPDFFSRRINDANQIIKGKIVHDSPILSTPMSGAFDSHPIIERISLLVEKGFFKNYSEAFQYYTTSNFGKSELAIGAKPAFILCNNMSFLRGGSIGSFMFKVLV